ncbi:MAG: hypothetical protein FWH07_07605, partial [Oscillospiraceae bacterium]|nr:hypothetical protein [Oscillospiraceae bacterium]
ALISPQISTDIIVKIALSDEKYHLLYQHVAYEDRFLLSNFTHDLSEPQKAHQSCQTTCLTANPSSKDALV